GNSGAVAARGCRGGGIGGGVVGRSRFGPPPPPSEPDCEATARRYLRVRVTRKCSGYKLVTEDDRQALPRVPRFGVRAPPRRLPDRRPRRGSRRARGLSPRRRLLQDADL